MNDQYDFEKLSESEFFDGSPEYDFSSYDILPVPIEIFAPDARMQVAVYNR